MEDTLDLQTPYIIDMLSALTGVALGREADDLAMPMFDAVRIFRPKSPRLDSFEGWFCIRRGDLPGATRHLTAAVEALGAEAGPARALLAMVNGAQGDPTWAAQAQVVIEENTDAASVDLMHKLKGIHTGGEHSGDAEAIPASSPSAEDTASAAIMGTRRFMVRG